MSLQTIWQQTVMTVHTLALPTSTTRLYRRCFVPTQATLTQNWCKLKVQSPHHEGGYVVTPTAASGLAAFYSATSRFVAFLANLPHGGAWLHDGQVLADHDTWSNPQLQALVQTYARRIQEYKCVERQLQGPAPAAPVVDQGPQVNSPLLSPPLNQLAQLRTAWAHGENAENAQEELHKACGCRIKGESRQQS